jgi:N-acetylmuramoyl-L-alanine amidase
LIIVIISTAVFMPLMIFMFANSSAFAGNMIRVEGKNPDGDIVEMADGGELLEADGNTVIVEGIDDPESASLCIPLSDDTDVNQIRFAEDPIKGRIDIAIPTEVKNFYYKNELTGTRKGITGLVYDYKNDVARFVLTTDKYYISSLHLLGDELYLTLKTPREVYGHVCVIEPAHGGEDTGSMAYGVTEKDIVLQLAKSVIQSAESGGDGGFFTVRNDDEEVSDTYKQHLVSMLEPDVYVTFELSSDEKTRTTNGIRAAAKDSEAKRIADELTAAISGATGQPDLGAELDSSIEGEKGVKNIVLYLGYITNKKEALLVSDAAYDAEAGRIIHEILSQNTAAKDNE